MIAEVAAKQSKRDAILSVNNIINFENIFEIIIKRSKKVKLILIAKSMQN